MHAMGRNLVGPGVPAELAAFRLFLNPARQSLDLRAKETFRTFNI